VQYFGGKAKLAPKIVPVLQAYADTHAGYWEPFCGALNTFSKVEHTNKVASDACGPLIALYHHVKSGGELPLVVTEEDYARAKRGDCEPWYQAFVGFGCSFAGKWFGGYARGGHGADAKTAASSLGKKFGRNYAANAVSSLEKKRASMQAATFIHMPYDNILMSVDCEDEGMIVPPWLIYCDPPYAGTTGYGAVKEKWDANAFWIWAQRQATKHTVLVSEYTCPVPHELVASWSHRTEIRTHKSGNQNSRVEKLFRVLPKKTLDVPRAEISDNLSSNPTLEGM